MYFVYLLECADKSLYTGITTDIARRLAEHRSGRGAKYTRSRRAGRVVYSERKRNRSTASRREAQIKSWPRAAKLALIRRGK
ncbi:MAG TPA: GIY-YIG nuclease family protein [Candidatus Paceibacterota bacterium]